MNNTLFRPYMRRSRCEIAGCKCYASYEIGSRAGRPIMVICENHARDLQGSVNSIMNRAYHNERQEELKAEAVTVEKTEFEAPVAKTNVVEPAVAEVLKSEVEPTSEPKRRGRPSANTQGNKAVSGKNFYTCKYCGKKFDKAEMTFAQFALHSKACKKEHSDGNGD